jgi:hypothetical protein
MESTGDKPNFKIISRNEKLLSELMAEGAAWNVTMLVEPEKIILQYFANEACGTYADVY